MWSITKSTFAYLCRRFGIGQTFLFFLTRNRCPPSNHFFFSSKLSLHSPHLEKVPRPLPIHSASFQKTSSEDSLALCPYIFVLLPLSSASGLLFLQKVWQIADRWIVVKVKNQKHLIVPIRPRSIWLELFFSHCSSCLPITRASCCE